MRNARAVRATESPDRLRAPLRTSGAQRPHLAPALDDGDGEQLVLQLVRHGQELACAAADPSQPRGRGAARRAAGGERAVRSAPLLRFQTLRYPSPPAQRRVRPSSASTISEMKSSCSFNSWQHRRCLRSHTLTTPSSSLGSTGTSQMCTASFRKLKNLLTRCKEYVRQLLGDC